MFLYIFVDIIIFELLPILKSPVMSLIKNFLLFMALFSCLGMKGEDGKEKSIKIYDHAVFYDGYLNTDNPDKDLKDGILRHSTSLYSIKLSDSQIDSIGDKLDMTVYVTACCDNYDRIGNINIAFVPKNQDSYDINKVERIEIARFITPFMDKNKEPNTVPYSYNLDNVSSLLKDKDLRSNYDFWIEYELFGVPYAANKQIEGCEGRNDTFAGTLIFETSGDNSQTSNNVLVPIVIKKPETEGNNLNNYNANATDTIGKTTKTYVFEVPENVKDAQIVLITSNHGANRGGEEYNRRNHYIYYDDELVMEYKPGRTSCEPFRERNTQRNGIYGRRVDGEWSYEPYSDEEWQSFSNWCPGDVIDTRLIILGDVEKGKHKVRISVPEAEFVDQQGDIPVSMYFQGIKNNP